VHRAEELLSAAEESFKRSNLKLKKIVAAGDLRRGCELVSNLALAAEQPGGKTSRLQCCAGMSCAVRLSFVPLCCVMRQ